MPPLTRHGRQRENRATMETKRYLVRLYHKRFHCKGKAAHTGGHGHEIKITFKKYQSKNASCVYLLILILYKYHKVRNEHPKFADRGGAYFFAHITVDPMSYPISDGVAAGWSSASASVIPIKSVKPRHAAFTRFKALFSACASCRTTSPVASSMMYQW